MLDASVLVNALADDGNDGDLARERISRDTSLHCPHLVDLEVLSVLRRREAAGDLDTRRSNLALDDLEELAIVRYPHLPFASRIWELRKNLTSYDACYIALAESLNVTFVTADAGLQGVPGVKCDVEVVSWGKLLGVGADLDQAGA